MTGGYPGVIKKSFDMLMGGQTGALPFVLTAIVGITLARATLLFLQAVATNRFILRLTSDMQKLAFRHLINADFARLSRETTIQNADMICVMEAGRLVERGKHSELVSRNGSYARLSRSAYGARAMIAN